MQEAVKQAAKLIREARLVVALTGAGISVESGIPPFRGKGGLWEKMDPMEFAHIDSFLRNPARVWDILVREMKGVVDRAMPNAGHINLARLEEAGRLSAIITQNVDGLHQRAGSTEVIEFHGTFALQRCMRCGKTIPTEQVSLNVLPPLCECGGILRPDCVFFGEAIPADALDRSYDLSSACDVMLVIGTSAVVMPAASMPRVAKKAGAKIIEINTDVTPLSTSLTDLLLKGSAGEVLEKILKAL
ncbi:MAG: NAD-dependent deacylase [Deltaproteobacteria bacterium]|nr:NAD-dependent deacylase [Deltaproteobacteria bacterium]